MFFIGGTDHESKINIDALIVDKGVKKVKTR